MMAWPKRIALFVVVNLLVMATISLSFAILSQIFPLPTAAYGFLIFYCVIFGFGGALISLATSRMSAKWMLGVKVIDPQTQEPPERELLKMVQTLSQRAGLRTMPEVGIYDSAEVNAFATGPSKSRSLVAVSAGLLRTMSREQLEGVLGHELGHIANGDMVTMTLLQGVINSVVMILARLIANSVASQVEERSRYWVRFALVIVLDILLSILGSLVVNYFSRRREFRADQWGAKLAGYGSMLSALKALGGTTQLVDPEQRSLATLKIAAPSRTSFAYLFSTHPTLEERIRALQKAPSPSSIKVE